MSGYWPLRFMILLFLAPALLAIVALTKPNLLQSKSVQHGILIQQEQYLDHSSLVFAPRKWNVFYLQPADCDQFCINQQQSLNKLQIALGAATSRVVTKSITSQELNIPVREGSVIIIDPQGRYIMQYPEPKDFSGVLKDLRRLLKYSHV